MLHLIDFFPWFFQQASPTTENALRCFNEIILELTYFM